jgi:hypothetical protein
MSWAASPSPSTTERLIRDDIQQRVRRLLAELGITVF